MNFLEKVLLNFIVIALLVSPNVQAAKNDNGGIKVIRQILLILLVVVSSCMKQANVNQIVVEVPFVFSESFNPRKTFTVGDQLISEHIFGQLVSVNPYYGLQNSLAKVEISKAN